jgi:N-acyl-D-amino-acid deacylase
MERFAHRIQKDFPVKKLTKTLAICAVVLTGMASLSRMTSQPVQAADMTYDIIIRNGRVMDGSGNPWVNAEIGISQGKIAAIGDLSKASAKTTIDARGLLVTPGFIDMHSHCDSGFASPALRSNEPWVRQGVTTVMVGVDGRGTWEPEKTAKPWQQTGTGTNYAFYVGHNSIRKTVMGIENRAPTPAELEKMKALVKEGMENGDFGISTGLEYIPGIYSKTDEVVELSKIAASYHGIYETHYRDEFLGFLDSVDEGITISKEANIPVHLDHFKIIAKHNWWMMDEGLKKIRAARASGLDITLDQYPWDNGATSNLESLIQVPTDLQPIRGIYDQLHAGGAGGGHEDLIVQYRAALVKTLADPAGRAALRRATEEGLKGDADPNWIHNWGYDWIRVVRSKKHKDYVNQLISDIAGWRGTTGFDVVADLISTEGPDLGISIGPMLEENVQKAMKEPYMAFSSDGALTPFGVGFPHPRAYGSFARVYRKYVREDHVITLEDAVRKMTTLPAQIIGFTDRGRIAVGNWADITIFDPQAMVDKTTYAEPHQYAEGVSYVLVNGVPVLAEGKMTGSLPGKLLLHHS